MKYLKLKYFAVTALAVLVASYAWQIAVNGLPSFQNVSISFLFEIMASAVFIRCLFIIYPRKTYFANEFNQSLVIVAIGAMVLRFGPPTLAVQLASTAVFAATIFVGYFSGLTYQNPDYAN